MKTFSRFAIAGFVILAMVLTAFAGTWGNNAKRDLQPYGEVITFSGTLAGADTVTSNSFKLGKFDQVSWTTFPFTVEYEFSQANDSVAVTGYVDGTVDGVNWTRCDTIVSATDTSRTSTTHDLNNKKFVMYRLQLFSTADTGVDAGFNIYFWAYQEQY